MKIVPFKKLPMVDIVKLIDTFNLTQEQILLFFGKTTEDIDTYRYMIEQNFGRKSIVKDFTVYEPYVNGHISFDDKKQKASKLDNAFQNIPNVLMSVEQFCTKYNVSVATLRQAKRFDKFAHIGKISFRTVNNQLLFCRKQQGGPNV